MSSYHNAVSDKLVVFLYPSSSVFTVFSKDNVQKFSSDNGNLTTLPDALKESIFSTTSTISMCARSTLVPLSEDIYTSYFQANYGEEHLELRHQNTDDFRVVYESTPVTQRLLSAVVNPQEHTDINLMHKYAAAIRHENALYYWLHEHTISLMVWKDGKLLAVNRYTSETKDEVFYYVMLAVEQLELPLDKLYFGSVGSTQEHASHKVMFQNYLPPLQQCSAQSTNSTDAVAQFFAECVL